MLKSHTFWLKTASVFQLLTGGVHSIGLFSEMQGQNETEQQMIDLMTGNKMDMGAGFNPTMMDLFLALSSCFTFLNFLGGLNNFFLIGKLSGAQMKTYLLINVILFGICFAVMLFLTFLPPATLTGLVFLFLVISYLTVPKQNP